MKITTVGLIGMAAALAVGVTGCNRAQDQGPDPASANMAPGGQTEPVVRNEAPVQYGGYEAQLNQAPAPPPPLPQYSQPACPGENYMWTPGYWAYSTAGYYWTPGAWVEAPYVGALWTPPWWGYSGGVYVLNAGYWGPYVGFYGGIDYGFGYTGRGFYGGYWQGGAFNYNRTVMNVNTTVVRNVYERRVTNYTPVNRISYNGGNGGVNLRPIASEEAAMRARRMGAAPAQVQYQREAAANREQFAAANHGRPSITAARPMAALPAGVPGDRRGPGEAVRNEVPAANARSEARGAVETRGMQRPPEAPGNGRTEPARPGFQPGQPAVAGRPYVPEQRRPEAPVNGRPEPARPGFQPGQPAVAARPSMPEQRPAQAAPNRGQAPNRQGFQPGRPAEAARPSMPEQRPSPFQPQMNRAPMPQQQHSADRRMPEARPQAPAAARPAPQEARPPQQPQHMAPEARPAAPQGKPAQGGHPEPPRQDDGKRSK